MKKIITMLLAVIMLLSLLPMSGFAEEKSAFELNEIFDAAKITADFVNQNRALPQTVSVSGSEVTLAEFTYLASKAIVNVNQNLNTAVDCIEVGDAKKTTNIITAGDLTASRLYAVAKAVVNSVVNNGRLPNYVTTELGRMAVETYTVFILQSAAYYANNGAFASTMSVVDWTEYEKMPPSTPMPTSAPTPTPKMYSLNFSEATKTARRANTTTVTNKLLPGYITVSIGKMKMPELLLLCAKTVVNIANGDEKSDISYFEVQKPQKPAENMTEGTLTKEEYIQLAKEIVYFTESMGMAPSYARTKLGDLSYQTLVVTYTSILASYYRSVADLLPTSVDVVSWETFSGNKLPMPGVTSAPKEPMPTETPFMGDGIQIEDIQKATKTVKTYIEESKELPETVVVANKVYETAQYVDLATKAIMKLAGDYEEKIVLSVVKAPVKSVEELTGDKLTEAAAVSAAKRINACIESNGAIPTYLSITGVGKLGYNSLVYIFTNMLVYHADNGAFEAQMTVTAWEDFIADSSFSIHFIDVGQADAALIECDGHYMLIDGGNRGDSSLIYSVLEKEQVSMLDILVATHAHEDHIGGLPGALNYATANLILCPVTNYDSNVFDNFVEYANKNANGITVPEAGAVYKLGSADVKILGLNFDDETNNTSIVLKITYGKTTFLFTGDAEREAEEILLDSGVDLSATVLKVGHHGGSTSTTYPFLREIMPEYAVISAGKGNSYDHPTEETLSKLRDAEVKLFRTDLQGDIYCTSDGETVSFTVDRNKDIYTYSKDSSTPPPTEAPSQPPTPEPTPSYTFVHSKTSATFHCLTCSYANRIKEENRVYRTETLEEMLALGYTGCKTCIK